MTTILKLLDGFQMILQKCVIGDDGPNFFKLFCFALERWPHELKIERKLFVTTSSGWILR